MTIHDWLILEKEDLDIRIRRYSGFRLLVLLSAIIGFLISLFLLWQKTQLPKMKSYDLVAINFVNKIKNPSLTAFFSLVTNLGSNFFIVISFLILVLILVKKRRKRAATVSLISLLGTAVFIYFFKHFFGRPRPVNCLGNDCLSFPSGHSTISSYFYGLLDYLIFRFLPMSLKTFLLITFPLVLLVLLIAASRLFLELHYLSDIMAGFFLGGAWLFIAILFIDILYKE